MTMRTKHDLERYATELTAMAETFRSAVAHGFSFDALALMAETVVGGAETVMLYTRKLAEQYGTLVMQEGQAMAVVTNLRPLDESRVKEQAQAQDSHQG